MGSGGGKSVFSIKVRPAGRHPPRCRTLGNSLRIFCVLPGGITAQPAPNPAGKADAARLDKLRPPDLIDQVTAQEAFNAVSRGGFNDLQTVLAICERHGDYCVIGGLAVNSYVQPVYTMEAELVISADTLPAVRADLVAAGFTVHDETWSLNAQRPGSELRIQFTKNPRYQGFIAAAVPAKVVGCDARVAALRDLVTGKTLAWSDPKRRLSKRKKDEADLIRLAEVFPEVRPMLPETLRRQL